MKSFAALLAVTLAIVGLVNQVKAFKSSKEKISHYLEQHESSTEVGANLAAAENLLHELNQKPHRLGSSKRVDLLTRLLTMKESLNQCNEESFQAFVSFRDEWFDTGRAYDVVKQAKEIEHPKKCLPQVQEQVASSITSVEPKALELVEGYTDIAIKHLQIFASKIGLVNQSLRELLQKGIVYTRDSDYDQEVVAFARRQQNIDDPQSVGAESEQQVVNKYITEPCKLYTEKLRPLRPLWIQLICSKVEMDESFIRNIYRFEVCDYRGQDNELEKLPFNCMLVR